MKTNADRDLMAVAVDNVIFNHATKAVSVLLIRRRNDPYKDHWALPGGFVDYSDKSLEEAAVRELSEETGLALGDAKLEQLFTVGDINRDPRGPVVAVIYGTVGRFGDVAAGDDAADARWWSIHSLDSMDLAFDHGKIIDQALKELFPFV